VQLCTPQIPHDLTFLRGGKPVTNGMSCGTVKNFASFWTRTKIPLKYNVKMNVKSVNSGGQSKETAYTEIQTAEQNI
jgi:hypothetical protein